MRLRDALKTMFDYELRPSGFSVPLFLLQQFLVPLLSLVIGVLVSALFEGNSPIQNALMRYLVFSAIGFWLGYKMQKTVPRARYSGGPWVWIAPVCLLIWGFFDTLRIEPDKMIAEVFIGNGPETGYILIFNTLPVVACCFYSLALIAASRRSKPSAETKFHEGRTDRTG
jgi:hypothetical protein